MKTITFVLLAHLLSATSVYCNSADATIAESLTLLRKGEFPPSRLAATLENQSEVVTPRMIQELRANPNKPGEDAILRYTFRLEKKRLMKLGRPCNSINVAYLDELIALMKDPRFATYIDNVAVFLRGNCPPSMLDKYREDFESILLSSLDWDLLLLYSNLHGVTHDTSVINLGNLETSVPPTYPRNPDANSIDARVMLDCVLARYGNKDAEKRLCDFLTKVNEGSTITWESFIEVVSLANSEGILSFLTGGLRSTDVIIVDSFQRWPKNRLYAELIVRMLRCEPGLPFQPMNLRYTDDNIDQLEKWCVDVHQAVPSVQPKKTWDEIIAEYSVKHATETTNYAYPQW